MEKQKYQAYAAATQTVAKTRQIVMLYDGAIRFVQQAKDAITENRIEDRYNLLTKANEIIMGLQGCLDFERGGDIAKILYSYYSTITDSIFSIHRTNDPDSCDEIIAQLKEMRDIWHEIDQDDMTAAATVAALPDVDIVAPVAPEESDNNRDNSDNKPPTSGVTISV